MLHKQFVVVPIDKASNNLATICKRYYVGVLLEEIGRLGGVRETYFPADLMVNAFMGGVKHRPFFKTFDARALGLENLSF